MVKSEITFTDIKAYIDLFKVTDIDFFIDAIRALENELARLKNDRIQSSNRDRQLKG